MSKRLVDYDPLTKTATYHDYDHGTGKTFIQQVQDCKHILERNKRKQNDSIHAGRKDDWYHFASVPNQVIMEWKSKYNLDIFNEDDLPKIEKLLQSREYMYLRTVNRI